jgi:hypothetical protein
VRLLAPLAYLSPRIVESIANGEISVDLTASSLARNLPLAWSEQERAVGLLRSTQTNALKFRGSYASDSRCIASSFREQSSCAIDASEPWKTKWVASPPE